METIDKKYNPITNSLSQTLTSLIGSFDDKKFNSFDRLRLFNEITPALKLPGFVFFTRPMLNLEEENDYDTFISVLRHTDAGKKIISSLDSMNTQGDLIKSPFIPLLTNTAKNFETKAVVIDTMELGDNFLGDNLVTPTSTIESTKNDTFSINYVESKDMSVIFLHKVWVEYMHLIRRGLIAPRDDLRKKRQLDFVSSCFYFSLAEDGETIKYWAKYTGLFPKNIPYDIFSYDLGESGIKDVGIDYVYNFKEDLRLEIFADFNSLVEKSITPLELNSATFSSPTDTIYNTWTKTPYIQGTNGKYKLKFINL